MTYWIIHVIWFLAWPQSSPISVNDWDWQHEITGRNCISLGESNSPSSDHGIANRSHRGGLDLPVRLGEWNGLAMLENHRLVLLGHAPRLQKTRHSKDQTFGRIWQGSNLHCKKKVDLNQLIRLSAAPESLGLKQYTKTSITISVQFNWVLGQVV